jgi:pyruvate formate lyase activating enzyme
VRRGMVFDIQRWSLHDGPGIRTIVFLKGCPLRCTWCCNPESQAPHAELALFADKCIGCHRCIALCPHGAISATARGLQTDWSVCRSTCYNATASSFPCTAKCYSKARRAIGGMISVDEVMTEVLKDSGIYGQGGGGMTLSGGEPMSQCDFARDLAQAAKENWLQVAMETCGFAPWSSYQEILPFVDFLFLDIKYFDEKRHQELTGQTNKLILENAPLMADSMRQKGGKIVVRIPVIPGLTDHEDVEKIARFVSTRMPGVETLELMPYHRLGRGKYGDIGRQYELGDLQPPGEEQMQTFREIVSHHGLALRYS